MSPVPSSSPSQSPANAPPSSPTHGRPLLVTSLLLHQDYDGEKLVHGGKALPVYNSVNMHFGEGMRVIGSSNLNDASPFLRLFDLQGIRRRTMVVREIKDRSVSRDGHRGAFNAEGEGEEEE
ncbi:uncharacterized protein A4U43_C04F960 [Asparagus officinalis]|uniref:Uncharacterized protein n=1 Tax=Asparagus officinalis TaxID=4686 RepID=A0A5P1EXT2_ASPOF|nr:uncharacterized protein A4U43_C04F960 [Asparagus officinalis]